MFVPVKGAGFHTGNYSHLFNPQNIQQQHKFPLPHPKSLNPFLKDHLQGRETSFPCPLMPWHLHWVWQYSAIRDCGNGAFCSMDICPLGSGLSSQTHFTEEKVTFSPDHLRPYLNWGREDERRYLYNQWLHWAIQSPPLFSYTHCMVADSPYQCLISLTQIQRICPDMRGCQDSQLHSAFLWDFCNTQREF